MTDARAAWEKAKKAAADQNGLPTEAKAKEAARAAKKQVVKAEQTAEADEEARPPPALHSPCIPSPHNLHIKPNTSSVSR